MQARIGWWQKGVLGQASPDFPVAAANSLAPGDVLPVATHRRRVAGLRGYPGTTRERALLRRLVVSWVFLPAFSVFPQTLRNITHGGRRRGRGQKAPATRFAETGRGARARSCPSPALYLCGNNAALVKATGCYLLTALAKIWHRGGVAVMHLSIMFVKTFQLAVGP
jgi:hypothetical protein